MLLITYSTDIPQDFGYIQTLLNNIFSNEYQKECTNFVSCGRKTTEISFLFLEKEIRVFYSIPRCDEYDIISTNDGISIKDLMLKVYNALIGNVAISAHLSYIHNPSPKQYIHLYLPEDCKTDNPEVNNYFRQNNNLSCYLYTAPYDTKEIQFVLHTYDDILSSITNTIDGSQKTDFIPRFFSLVTLLMYGR
jgi:hypothetical protein